MRTRLRLRQPLTLIAAGLGFAVGGYAAWIAVSWCRFGRVTRSTAEGQDALLEQFMPKYDVVERHHIHVAAPPAVTLAAAGDQNLMQMPLVHAIFRAREIALGTVADTGTHPTGLLAATRSLGWGVLAESPGREIVMGAVTRPWEANITFHALPPEQFAAFEEPGFVKIAWTLRADPAAGGGSIFRTETRAVATDLHARARFRRYWAFVSPGIALIRRLSLGPLKRAAERRSSLTAYS